MPVQAVRQQIKDQIIDNAKVDTAAGILESKLALNYPTHSNANDPTFDQKAALAGEGPPSGENKYTTKSYLDSHAESATGVHGAGASTLETVAGSAEKVSIHDGTVTAHAVATNLEQTANREAVSGYAGLDSDLRVIRDPANATATPTADKIPIASATGWLTSWIEDATPDNKGLIQLTGQIGGTATSPDVRGIRESGATLLALGAIADGEFLRRVGDVVVGAAAGGGGGAENTTIALNEQSADTAWFAVGSVPLDPDDFQGLEIRFTAVANVSAAQAAGDVQLYNLTDGGQTALLSYTETVPTRKESAVLQLPAGTKIYETRIKRTAGGASDRILLGGALFAVR